MRMLVILVSALMLVLATSVSPGVVRAAAPVPKVAVIVGPVGSLTHAYITLADEAAKAATAAGASGGSTRLAHSSIGSGTCGVKRSCNARDGRTLPRL